MILIFILQCRFILPQALTTCHSFSFTREYLRLRSNVCWTAGSSSGDTSVLGKRMSLMKPRSKTGRVRDLFDIDRGLLLCQVTALRRTVRNALTELSMIAAENVFAAPLTAKLKQNALALNRMAARLDALTKVLARAKPFASRK
jgi:hypothetical protein